MKKTELHTTESSSGTQWGDNNHLNIFRRVKKDASRERIYQLTESLITCPSLLDNHRSVVLYGYGEHMKSTYTKLDREDGLTVLWHGSCLPGLFRLLGFFVASEMGLVQVTNAQRVPQVFDTLSDLAVVELYSFSTSLLHEVSETARRYGREGCRPYEIILPSKSFFCFGTMGDSESSPTGIACWAWCGVECPEDLQKFIERMIQQNFT